MFSQASTKFTSISFASPFYFSFQAETCSIAIPELKFEMGGFALGGRFTTLEGLLTNIDEQVADNPFLGALATGDSARSGH